MRRENIKKAKRYDQYVRPRKAPFEFLFVTSEVLICADNTYLNLKEGTKIIGAFGKNTEGDVVTRLVKTGHGGFVWIKSEHISQVEAWSSELQNQFDHQYNTAENEIKSNAPRIDTSKFLIIVKVNGNEELVSTDFRGRLIKPMLDCSTMKEYLKKLKKEYGKNAVSYEYQIK